MNDGDEICGKCGAQVDDHYTAWENGVPVVGSYKDAPDGRICSLDAGAVNLKVSELQNILYRVRWHVSTDNFCDCHAGNGEPHKNENCLLLVLASVVEKSPKCCPPFEPEKRIHSEFCRNYTKKQVAHCYGTHCHVMERGSAACICLCEKCKDAKENDH